MFRKAEASSNPSQKQDLNALANIFMKQAGLFAMASHYVTISPRCITSSGTQLSRHIFKNDLPMVLTGSEFIPFHYASHNYSRLSQEELTEFAQLLNQRFENRFEVTILYDVEDANRIQAYSFRNTNVQENPFKMWK